jgi:hypothetical protein
MTDLTTTTAVKRQLGLGANGTANTVDDDLIATYVTDASQIFETECARRFSPTVSTYLYDRGYPVTEGRTLYFRDDMLGVDSVVNGVNGTLTSAQYRLLPLDASPKYALQLLESSGLYWQIGNDGFNQNAIIVNGTSGYCLDNAVPADISLSVTKLASWLYMTRDNLESIQIAEGMTVLPAQAPAVVLRTINNYVRRASYVGGDHR